jgi:hypothetical protein
MLTVDVPVRVELPVPDPDDGFVISDPRVTDAAIAAGHYVQAKVSVGASGGRVAAALVVSDTQTLRTHQAYRYYDYANVIGVYLDDNGDSDIWLPGNQPWHQDPDPEPVLGDGCVGYLRLSRPGAHTFVFEHSLDGETWVASDSYVASPYTDSSFTPAYMGVVAVGWTDLSAQAGTVQLLEYETGVIA